MKKFKYSKWIQRTVQTLIGGIFTLSLLKIYQIEKEIKETKCSLSLLSAVCVANKIMPLEMIDDPVMVSFIKTSKKAGYSDKEIVDFFKERLSFEFPDFDDGSVGKS